MLSAIRTAVLARWLQAPVLLVVEAVRGRDLERRTKEWILQAGLAMIVALMVVVLVMDAIKKLEG